MKNNPVRSLFMLSAISLSLSQLAHAAPGIPAIEWMESNFALIDVAESGGGL